MTLDAIQARLMESVGGLAPEDLPATANALRAVVAEKSKMLGLYPKADTYMEYPAGPIALQIEIIEAGNRRLVTNSLENENEIIEVTAREQGSPDNWGSLQEEPLL